MEKQTLLAIALSAAVLIGWQFLFPPPPPPTSTTVPTATEVSPTVALEESEPAVSENSVSPLSASLPSVDESQPAKQVVVETPRYRLTFNTRGAVAESLLLQEYQHNKGRLTLSTWFPYLTSFLGASNEEIVTEDNKVNMFANDLDDVHQFAVELEDDPQLSARLQRTVFSESQGELLLEEGTASLQFVSPVVDGLQLIKTFEFFADSFQIGYRVQVINRSQEAKSLRIRHVFGEGRVQNDDYQQQGAHTGPVYFVEESVETETNSDVQQEFQVANAEWFGVEDQFFLNAVRAESPIRFAYFRSAAALVDQRSMLRPYFGARLPLVSLQPDRQIESNFRAYFGPKLEDEMLKFGHNLRESNAMFLETLAAPLLTLLHWIFGYVGNYGIAIIILTIIVRLLLFPLTYKGMKGMKRMQQLAPRMKKIQEKYKDNREKLNQEMMELYRKNKVNPLGGCLPLLLQIPVFIALYSALSGAVELRHAPFMLWLSDMSAPDGLGITPILMGVSLYFQQKLTPTAATMDPMQQKIMQYLPLVFTIFTFTFPAGLTLYWLTSNLLSIAQQQFLNRIKTPELQD
ncbi:MAG: membrane protein insertase YidC [bacterium]